MKKVFIFLAIMTASTAMLTSCSSDDPIENYMNGNNGFGPENNEPSGNTPSGNGSSAITGELTTFDIALDKTTAEPTDVADAYFPDEEDILENNEFTTEIAIDLSNPVAKTENGVGIHSADYIVFREGNNIYVKSTAKHGIKANDGVFINGGILNVEVSATAAKGINCESHIIVNGGRTTVLTTGDGTYDTDDQEAKGAAGIKADSTFTINAGELYLKSTGSGGKGINADGDATFNGGRVMIVTEGGQFSGNGDTSSPKGIKVDGDLTIKGGKIWVRTSGENGEGIETKSALNITGGEVASYAYDDAINSKGDMTISGGYVYAHGRNNDGLDANGDCYIKGGLVYAICSGTPEVAIDANTEDGYKLYISGGTVIALGGLESGAQLSQSCYQASWTPNTWYALTVGKETFLFQTPSSGGSGLVVSGSSQPTLLSGVSVNGGTSYFGGIGIIGTVSGGSSVELSSYTGGGFGPGGGGFGPGGWH